MNEAASIADKIVKVVGLNANFKIAEADVPNALAVLQQGRRYILYNPSFVNKLTRATGTQWAAVSILAHEIGHHLYNVLEGKPNRSLATPFATATHPARQDRINSIANGWELAGGIITEDQNRNEPALPSSSILARIEFNKNPQKDYFITNSLNVVNVENEEVSVIGLLSKSNDENYPFIISGSDGYRLFISSVGQVVNQRGIVVGRVKKG